MIIDHTYGIIDVFEFEHEDCGSKFQLLKIRNPWGEHEWNGDWSTNSKLWTDELKAKLGFSELDNGIFWMNFEDFSKCFKLVHICKFKDSYLFNNYKVESSESKTKYHLLTLKTTSPGEQTLSIS